MPSQSQSATVDDWLAPIVRRELRHLTSSESRPPDAGTPDIPPPNDDSAQPYTIRRQFGHQLTTQSATLSVAFARGSERRLQVILHQYGDQYVVSDSAVKFSAKFNKKTSEELKHTYAQRIGRGAILILSSFDLSFYTRRIGEAYKRDVQLTITGLHGRGVHSGKSIPDAKKYQHLKNVDFVDGFFSRLEQNISRSGPHTPDPTQTETSSLPSSLLSPLPSSLPKQPPSSTNVSPKPNETSTNDVPEQSSPLESVQERNRNQGDPGVNADVVQNKAPTGITSQPTTRGQGAWIRDFPQAVPFWGQIPRITRQSRIIEADLEKQMESSEGWAPLAAGQKIVEANLPETILDRLKAKTLLRRAANGTTSSPAQPTPGEPESTPATKPTPALEDEPVLEAESSASDDEDEERPLGSWENTPAKPKALSERILPPDTPISTPSKPRAPALSHPDTDDRGPPVPTQESDYMTQEAPKAVQTESQQNLALRSTPSKQTALSPSMLQPTERTPLSHQSNSPRMRDAVSASPHSVRSDLSEKPVVGWIGDAASVNNTIIPCTQHPPAEILATSSTAVNAPDSSEAVANISPVPKPKSSGPETNDVEKQPKRKGFGLEVDDDPEDEQRYQKRARSDQPGANEPQTARPPPILILESGVANERRMTPRVAPTYHVSRSLELHSVRGSSPPHSGWPIPSDQGSGLLSKRHSLSRKVVMREYTAEEIYEGFRAEYTEYTGSMDHFRNMCILLRSPRKLRVPKMAWDDFICRHLVEYRPYCDECVMNAERPMDYEDYYDEFATSINHPLKIMKPDMVDTVIRELQDLDG